jgi:5-methyltetrahydrofolate--homocysteine methyltransferase
LDEYIKPFEINHDDYSSILAKALADRLAEAAAEYVHYLVRTDYWGYQKEEALTNEQMINEEYQGIRPAPGYPACPDHLEKMTIWNLLEVEKNTGMTLTESLAMHPAASVSGYYFAHLESKYFGIGKITDEQVADFAARKGIQLEEAQRWLAPNIL